MNSLTDQQLLRDYSERHSETAFAELARRHVDFVYSAALRMVRDTHLAEDVTQGVFVALAQNARQLANRPVLSGWLHRTTQNLAANVVRSDVRRRVREQEAVAMNVLFATEPDAAWEHIAPHLDAALGELSEPDRDALLLRYFERKSAREMAQSLGTSEDAAQKRVNRAVGRLRACFAKRGVTIGANALAVVISANAVQAAPVGLAVTISAATTLAGTTLVATTATAITTKTIIMTTLQKTILAVTLSAAVATGIFEARQISRLRSEVQTLQQQHQTLEQQHATLAQENGQLLRARDGAANRLVALARDIGNTKAVPAELLRLRGEVTRLGAELRESPMARIASLKHKFEEMPDKRIPEMQFLTEKEWALAAWDADLNSNDGARRAFGALRERAIDRFLTEGMAPAVQKYIAANGGILPPDLFQLKPYFETPVTDEMLQRYQLLQAGKPDADAALVRLSAHVDEEYDAQFTMSLKGIQGGDYNLARETVKIAAGEFAKANNEERPSEASQLAPYLKHPLDAATIQKYFQRYLEDAARPLRGPTTIRKVTENTGGKAPENP